MKLKATKRTIRDNAPNLWCVGYCELQYLLRGIEPFAYSAGVYGWACDYYNLTPYIVLSTGYSPIGKRLPYEIVRKYEKRAAVIWGDYDKPYESKTRAVARLREKFINEIRNHLDNNPLNE